MAGHLKETAAEGTVFQGLVPVVSNEEVMPGTFLLWLVVPPKAAPARPGQFFLVRCAQGYDPLLRRPLSLHRLQQQGSETRLAFLFAVVGRGTRWLSQRRQGEVLDLLGPLGQGFTFSPGSRLLLVAGGIGIAPLVALAEEAMAARCQIALLLGSTTAATSYSASRLPPSLEVALTTEDGSLGQKGLVTDLVSAFLSRVDAIYACGPPAMYGSLAAVLNHHSFSGPVQVLLEEHMACGLGGCYGCAVKTADGMKLVCRDGPCFELRQLPIGSLKGQGG